MRQIAQAELARLWPLLRATRTTPNFEAVMQRWAALVLAAATPDAPIEHETALAREIIENAPKRRIREPKSTRRGRPRADRQREAALWLAIIYNHFSNREPSRTHREGETAAAKRDNSSPYFRFADASFRAIGITPSVGALRWVVDNWSGLDVENDKSYLFRAFVSTGEA
jgi:hypothetical protein